MHSRGDEHESKVNKLERPDGASNLGLFSSAYCDAQSKLIYLQVLVVILNASRSVCKCLL